MRERGKTRSHKGRHLTPDDGQDGGASDQDSGFLSSTTHVELIVSWEGLLGPFRKD